MRLLFVILLALNTINFTRSKKAITQSYTLNGNWVPVKEEIAGIELPSTSFQKQKLVMSDSNYTFTAESVDKGVTKYAAGKMDIYGKEGVNTGKHFMAIYKLENDSLSICYNRAGNGYPDSYDTKGKP